MNTTTKILSLFISGLILLSSCGGDAEVSPYDKIFAEPLFAGISDSIRKQPKNDELYFRRAVLLNSNNLPEPALADFQKAWSLKKEERYAYGISSLLAEKKPDSAVVFLQTVLPELPQSILLRLNLVRSYNALNKTDEALKVCDEILQLNPQQVDVLKMQADLFEKKGNIPAAISTLEKAYNLTPFDLELNYMLALKYAENKNPKVIGFCDSLIRQDTERLHAEPYYYKGIYYAALNDRNKALGFFDEAIKVDFYFLDAYIEKGILFYDQKKFAEAYKIFNLAMSISPKFADAYYWMAKSEEAMGQKEEARLNYQRAYGLDKTFAEAKEAADRLSK